MADSQLGMEYANWHNAPSLSDHMAGKGLLALGVQASGLGDWLNSKGISQDEKGKWQYKQIPGAAVPTEGQQGFVGPSMQQPVVPPSMTAYQVPQTPQPQLPQLQAPTLPGLHPDIEDSWK